MNLRVDLILPDEQRSTSPVSLAFIVRMAAVLGIVIVVGGIALFVFNVMAQGKRLRDQKERWVQLDERLKKELAREKKLVRNVEIHAQLKGWRNARMHWKELLDGFKDAVPADIQMERMTVTSSMGAAGIIPTKTYDLVLKARVYGVADGRAYGCKDTKGEVERFARSIPQDSVLKKYVKSATVVPGTFRKGLWPGAAENDRSFCKLKLLRYQ